MRLTIIARYLPRLVSLLAGLSLAGAGLAHEADGEFQFGRGVTGSWHNPDTPGQGMFVEMLPAGPQSAGDRIAVAWFTFTDGMGGHRGGGHRWFTAVGEAHGDHAHLDLNFTQGGHFNAPGDIEHRSWGSMLLRFGDCGAAFTEFDMPNGFGGMLHGQAPLARVTPPVGCTAP